jgi:hypothetical protein
MYDLLPEEDRKEAVGAWEKVWDEDFGGLIHGANKISSLEVADTLMFAVSTRFKKYCVRAKGFVDMYGAIREEHDKLAKKNGALAKIKMPNLKESDWVKICERPAPGFEDHE